MKRKYLISKIYDKLKEQSMSISDVQKVFRINWRTAKKELERLEELKLIVEKKE